MNGLSRLPKISADSVAASIEAFAPVMAGRGTPLYATLCTRIPEDPELVAMLAHGLASATALQLFTSVQYLLMRDPRDPLARFYANLTENPQPPETAFADFAVFCKKHRDEILHLIKTRTIQVTTAERCKIVMSPLSRVAKLAGEPLNLIEIGCSAGVLLTFDKYAYDVKGRGLLGSRGAPLTLSVDVQGGPDLHIPKVDKRIGIDLCTIDKSSEDDRRWVMAHCFPELRDWQAQLTTALDQVAHTDISFLEGDALDRLPEAIEKTSGPLCIFHSACLLYWSAEAKAALNTLLLETSRNREIYRVGIEQPEDRSSLPNLTEVIVSHYRDGAVNRKFIGESTNDFSSLTWHN